MRYVAIPGTDLKPSNIVIGSVCSVQGDTSNAFRLMDQYHDQGGNIVDSANVYGKWFPGERNVCDINIGRYLRERGSRNQWIVVTKGGHPDLKDWSVRRLSRKDVAADLDESLQALDCGVIDIFYLHRDDLSLPVGEIIEYLNDFVREGKIRYFGCSNWNPERIREAQEYAHAHGLQGFLSNQLMWSLADIDMANYGAADTRKMDEKAYALHLETGMPAFAYSSLALGYFSQYANRAQKPVAENVAKMFDNPTNRARGERVEKLAKELGISINSAVLAYLFDRPFPTFAQVSTSRQEHLAEILLASEVSLTEEQKRYLTEAT